MEMGGKLKKVAIVIAIAIAIAIFIWKFANFTTFFKLRRFISQAFPEIVVFQERYFNYLFEFPGLFPKTVVF